MEKKLRKGALAMLDDAKCFTDRSGGERPYPLSNIRNDEDGVVIAYRPITDEETEAWYNSDASKGMTSAGETKLPPRCVRVTLFRGDTYRVLRARCRVMLGWGNPDTGMAALFDERTGETAYVKRDLLKVV